MWKFWVKPLEVTFQGEDEETTQTAAGPPDLTPENENQQDPEPPDIDDIPRLNPEDDEVDVEDHLANVVQQREDDDDQDVLSAACNPPLDRDEQRTCLLEGGGADECEAHDDRGDDGECPAEYAPNHVLLGDIERKQDEAADEAAADEVETCVEDGGDAESCRRGLHRSAGNHERGRW